MNKKEVLQNYTKQISKKLASIKKILSKSIVKTSITIYEIGEFLTNINQKYTKKEIL